MRTFSQFEKKIIRKIKINKEHGQHIRFTELMDDYLVDKGFRIDSAGNKSYILFNAKSFCAYDNAQNMWIPTNGNILAKMFNEINEVIIETIFLLEYLEKNGYIFFYKQANSTNNDYSKIPPNNPVSLLIISDQNITKILIDNFHKSIF
jgi:hypothetical protein